MQFVRSSALIATYLALSARALPRPNPAPTYQVVDAAGPSSEAAPAPETVYSTIVESSTPTTVTQPAITVTASPNAPAVETQSVTTTQKWTVVISNTEQPAYSHSSGSPPLPTLDGPQGAPPVTETATETIYNTVPAVPYAPESTSSTTSSALKGAFTPVSQWNHTVTAIAGPTSAGTALMYAVVPTGATFERRWVPFAATGTGAYLAGRAAPTGTGAYLAGRAAPTGTGAAVASPAASDFSPLTLAHLRTLYNQISQLPIRHHAFRSRSGYQPHPQQEAKEEAAGGDGSRREGEAGEAQSRREESEGDGCLTRWQEGPSEHRRSRYQEERKEIKQPPGKVRR